MANRQKQLKAARRPRQWKGNICCLVFGKDVQCPGTKWLRITCLRLHLLESSPGMWQRCRTAAATDWVATLQMSTGCTQWSPLSTTKRAGWRRLICISSHTQFLSQFLSQFCVLRSGSGCVGMSLSCAIRYFWMLHSVDWTGPSNRSLFICCFFLGR